MYWQQQPQQAMAADQELQEAATMAVRDNTVAAAVEQQESPGVDRWLPRLMVERPQAVASMEPQVEGGAVAPAAA